MIKTINPTTEQILSEYKIASKEQVKNMVSKARDAFRQGWNNKDNHNRADFLHNFAAELRKNKEKLARIATTEMGRVIKESRSEVDKCA